MQPIAQAKTYQKIVSGKSPFFGLRLPSSKKAVDLVEQVARSIPHWVQRINLCYHFCYQNEPKQAVLSRKTSLVFLFIKISVTMGNKSILSPDPGYEKKVGRNELCPCGSGRKSKNCRAH